MARWRPARSSEDLRGRIARQLKRRRIPNAVWKRAVEREYVREAFRLRRAEAALRDFVAAQIARLRERTLGYRKPGGKPTGLASELYDDYTRLRWEASGEADVPADFGFGKENGRNMVIIYARPWVPPAVVARLYALGRASFPRDVHGPHLKSLHLYLYVTDRRAKDAETWAETMEAWNEHAQDLGLPNTYTHVSNFHRDYHRIEKMLSV